MRKVTVLIWILTLIVWGGVDRLSADTVQNDSGFTMAEAVVESVQKLEYPQVRVTLKDLRMRGATVRDPSRLTALSFPGTQRTPQDRPRTESGEAPWYLKPGDRVSVFLWKQWGSNQWYLGRTERLGVDDEEKPVDKHPIALEIGIEPNPVSQSGTVRLKIAAKNVSGSSYGYQTSSGQQFDIEVTKDGRRVWLWSHDKFFTMAIQRGSIGAGETKTFTAEWDLTTSSGTKLPPGTYEVRAWLMIMGGDRPESKPVELVVRQ